MAGMLDGLQGLLRSWAKTHPFYSGGASPQEILGVGPEITKRAAERELQRYEMQKPGATAPIPRSESEAIAHYLAGSAPVSATQSFGRKNVMMPEADYAIGAWNEKNPVPIAWASQGGPPISDDDLWAGMMARQLLGVGGPKM